MKKNSCTPINPEKYSYYGLKKIHTRNLITKKIPAARKFPSPPPHPITFLVPKAHVHDEIFWSLTLIRIVKVITTNLNG